MVADSGSTVGDRDGGVSLRLGRRCRLAATILLALGAALLLAVALTSWGLISAVATLIAGALVIGAVFLARQAALWTSTRLKVLPGAPTPLLAGFDAAESLNAADASVNAANAPLDATWSAKPAPLMAIVGPPRPLSPPKPGAPIKRRLSAVVVPVHLDHSEQHADQTSAPGDNSAPGDVDNPSPDGRDNSAPGGGALIVHARSDSEALHDGDRVLVCHLGRHGFDQGSLEKPTVTGRFVLLRESDGQAFLATTRLTDTW